jgi:hypothetical protein
VSTISVTNVKHESSASNNLVLTSGGDTQVIGALGLGGATYGTSGQVLTSAGSGATPTWGAATNLTRVATQSASGAAITFGSLPSTVRKITILLNNVGASGTDNLLIMVGTSGGLITSGYTSRSQYADASSTSGSTATNGFLHIQSSGSVESAGAIELFNITGNIWVQKGITSTASALLFSAGLVDAGAQVTQVSIQFTGANTFDAGSFGLFYEV